MNYIYRLYMCMINILHKFQFFSFSDFYLKLKIFYKLKIEIITIIIIIKIY